MATLVSKMQREEDFKAPHHNHSTERITNPTKRTAFNWCNTCQDWYKPLARAAQAGKER